MEPDVMVQVRREDLCSVQWAGRLGREAEIDVCPSCGGIEPHTPAYLKETYRIEADEIGHRINCWLAKAAGLIP